MREDLRILFIEKMNGGGLFMSVENKATLGGITLKGRRELRVDGVEEVLSFDDCGVHLRCVDGELTVEGSEIRVQLLDTHNGSVTLEGHINGMYYSEEENKRKGGLWGRLMH